MQLDLDKSDQEIADYLVDYFNGISQEYEALTEHQIPVTNDRAQPLPLLTTTDVSTRIAKCKRPSSTVPGDLPPEIYSYYTMELSNPVAKIFNTITKENVWPSQLKIEHVSIIPKCFSHESASECRNILCTNF